MNMNTCWVSHLPIGTLKVSVGDGFINRIEFVDDSNDIQFNNQLAHLNKENQQLFSLFSEQVKLYFNDSNYSFELPLAPSGTDYQLRVWQALKKIPLGQTKTYGELAKELNSSARAVGNACRRNPLPLVVPCHRVVAANGIGGFSGQTGGYLLDIKKTLLVHEGWMKHAD